MIVQYYGKISNAHLYSCVSVVVDKTAETQGFIGCGQR